MDRLSQKLLDLFKAEHVTVIQAKDLLNVPFNKWQPLNGGKIRYKIIEKTDKHVVSLTEWLEKDILYKHLHEDADETVFVIEGQIRSLIDKLTRGIFKRLFYKAGTIHEVEADAGTKIIVKFEFI